MAYEFSFKLNSDGVPYKFSFYIPSTKVYQLFFWGFNLIEILRYTIKGADLGVSEQQKVVKNILLSDAVTSAYRQKVKELIDTAEVAYGNLSLLSDITVPVDKLVGILVSSFGTLDNYTKGKVKKYIEGLVVDSRVMNIWKNVQDVTKGEATLFELSVAKEALKDVNRATISEGDSYNITYTQDKLKTKYAQMVAAVNTYTNYLVEPDSHIDIEKSVGKVADKEVHKDTGKTPEHKFVDAQTNVSMETSRDVEGVAQDISNVPMIKQVDKNVIYKISKRLNKFISNMVNTLRKKLHYLEPDNIRDVHMEVPKEVTPIVELQNDKSKEVVPLTEVLTFFRPIVETVNQDVLKADNSKKVTTGSATGFNKMAEKPGISDIVAEIFSEFTKRDAENNSKLEASDELNPKGTDTPSAESAKVLPLEGADTTVMDVLKREVKKGLANIPQITVQKAHMKSILNPSVNCSSLKPTFIETPTMLADKWIQRGIDVDIPETTSIPLETAEAVVNTLKHKKSLAIPVVTSFAKHEKTATPNIKVYRPRYKTVKFGRRWRFKSGKAFDRIFINPRTSAVTEELEARLNVIDEFRRALPDIVRKVYREGK